MLIDWEPVTTSHPEIGKTGPVTISRYQFFVRAGKHEAEPRPSAVGDRIRDSDGITSAGGVWKFEIIARTSTNNNTAMESCFQMQ